MAFLLLTAGLWTGAPRTFAGELVSVRSDICFGNESGELRGIWISLYVGNQLISEQSSPETLLTKERWTRPEAD